MEIAKNGLRNFSIGVFYNISINHDNAIKTPKNTSFLGVTQPPGVAQPLYSRGRN